MTNVQNIIEKWYRALSFPSSMDEPFKAALENIPVDAEVTVEDYVPDEQNGAKNLLYFLYFCEALSEKYKEKGIPEKILYDTLGDLVVWTKTWSALKRELYLGETSWLKRHLGMKLFKLGRLQFCMAPSEFAIPERGVACGDPVVEVHIPEGEPLSTDASRVSLDEARAFFARYYPEHSYTVFTCHSWLLDSSLRELLSEGSNILKFASLFKVVREDDADAIFGYLFRWKITRSELKDCTPSSSFAARVREAALAGRRFHESLGYIEK